MDRALRLGRIDYINADPFFVGGRPPPEGVTIRAAKPTTLNRALLAGDLDASWISSVELLRNAETLIRVNPSCIAAPGPVRSVVLAGPSPLEELDGEVVRVSTHSATSVALLRLLLEEAGVSPHLEPFDPGRGVPAGTVLLIGDEALEEVERRRHPYVLDLADRWQAVTGRPMVFAVLAVRRDSLERGAVRRGLEAAVPWMTRNRRDFLADLDAHAAGPRRAGLTPAAYRRYFEGFQFDWTPATEAGLREFARRAAALGLVPAEPWPEELHPEAPEPGTARPSAGP